jgi:4-amino-4-deoxy-L-arabinose transferase-like glycosyltransferase
MNQPKAKKPEQGKKKPEHRKNLFERKSRKPLVFTAAFFILILVVAFVMRAVYLWQVRQAPEFALLVGDAVTYDEWASRIANGDWLGKGVFYQAPLYPYFLGILYTVFGRDLWVVRLVQIVLGAGSCALLARAGRSFFNRTTTGLLAGALLAVYPTAIFFDGSIQKSVLDLFFICALLAVLGKLLERSQNRWWLVAGLVLGLLALTRENALLFLPIVLAWLFITWRGELWKTRLQWAGLVLLGLAAVLLPVGYRNLRVGGEFHLTTAQFGPNFYIGNGRAATGFYEPL